MSDGFQRVLLSRRAFLTTAGALTVGVGLAAGYDLARDESRRNGRIINAFVSLLLDGRVQFVCPALELGQGAHLSLSMIIAEEMGADIQLIEVISAPRNDESYGNPDFDGRMVTADSKTTRGYFLPLRFAGAEARQALIETVCERKGWSRRDSRAACHQIANALTGESVSFAEIASWGYLRQPKLTKPLSLKPAKEFTLLGTSPSPSDARDVVMGTKLFGVDCRDRGTSVAVLARSGRLGDKVASVGDAAAKAVSGVEDVVVLDDAVAVVARDVWSALKGRAALTITWTNASGFNSADERKRLEAALDDQGRRHVSLREVGAFPGPYQYFAEFYAPTLKHVVLEPLNATARGFGMGVGVEISGSTQSQDLDMRFAAQTWKTAPFMVTTEPRPSGGAYGRRVLNDAVGDAAAVAKTLGRPVQVVRPMQDELRRGQVRPSAFQRIMASLSSDGGLLAWRHEFSSDGTLATHLPSSLKGVNGDEDNTATDGSYHCYRTPNDSIRWTYVPSEPIPGFLRGVSAGYTVWAIETMVERLARAALRDAVEWRCSHLDDHRLRTVLCAAAEMSGWGARGRHFGAGLTSFRGAAVASVAEVVGERVAGLWIAADVGRVIHRRNVLAQIEGGAVWGLSMALEERLVYSNGCAEVDGLADYPVLRLDKLPPIEIQLIEDAGSERPCGVGEVGVPTVIPAVCNAMESATGKVFNALPLNIAG